MTFNKGIDHISALFSLFFASFISFYLITIYPNPQHPVNACTLNACALSKPLRTPHAVSIAQTKTDKVSVTPTPAYIALIPTLTRTPEPTHQEITPSPTSGPQPAPATEPTHQTAQDEQNTSSAPVSTPPDQPHPVTDILTPLTGLVTKTTDLLR